MHRSVGIAAMDASLAHRCYPWWLVSFSMASTALIVLRGKGHELYRSDSEAQQHITNSADR
jgi:hypothetical protein